MPITLAVVLPINAASTAGGRSKPNTLNPAKMSNASTAAKVEGAMIGTGQRRRFRISAVAYDRTRSLLYVLEPFADGAQPVVHVWRLR